MKFISVRQVLGFALATTLQVPSDLGATELPIHLTIPAATAGRISSTGAVAGPNYLTGRLGGETYRGFVTFDLGSLAGYSSSSSYTDFHYTGGSWVRRTDRDLNPLNPTPSGVRPGELFAWQWVGTFQNLTTTQTTTYQPIQLSSVSLQATLPGFATASGDSLLVHDFNATGTGFERFADLGSGQLYGEVANPGAPFAIPIDPALVGLKLGVGLDLPTASDGEYVFGGTGSPIGISLHLEGTRDVSSSTAQNGSTEPPIGSAWVTSDLDGGLYLANQYQVLGYTMFGDTAYTADALIEPPHDAQLYVPEPGDVSRWGATALLVFAAVRRWCGTRRE